MWNMYLVEEEGVSPVIWGCRLLNEILCLFSPHLCLTVCLLLLGGMRFLKRFPFCHNNAPLHNFQITWLVHGEAFLGRKIGS